jgi:hypothetical protein
MLKEIKGKWAIFLTVFIGNWLTVSLFLRNKTYMEVFLTSILFAVTFGITFAIAFVFIGGLFRKSKKENK